MEYYTTLIYFPVKLEDLVRLNINSWLYISTNIVRKNSERQIECTDSNSDRHTRTCPNNIHKDDSDMGGLQNRKPICFISIHIIPTAISHKQLLISISNYNYLIFYHGYKMKCCW